MSDSKTTHPTHTRTQTRTPSHAPVPYKNVPHKNEMPHENESGFTNIPTRRFQSGDLGSYRQRSLKKPDLKKEQGTGGRDVDDNSPFSEPSGKQ